MSKPVFHRARGLVLLAVLGLASGAARAQWVLLDSFTDGDFTASPAWSGDTASFTVTTSDAGPAGGNNAVRLNYGTAAAWTNHLRLANTNAAQQQSWAWWWGRRSQAATAANRMDFWIYANEADLEAATVDGYRVSFGDDTGGDELRLERMANGAVAATVITSTGSVANGITDFGFTVMVSYSNGNWKLYTSPLPQSNSTGTNSTADPVQSSTVNQGSGTDSTYAPTNGYLGLNCVHSSSANARQGVELDQVYVSNRTAAVSAPSVTTLPCSNTNMASLSANGNVTSDGGATITNRGVCYKTSSGVTIGDNKTACSSNGVGVFSLSLPGLTTNTHYYFVAYAENSAGSTLGSELDCWTLAAVPSAPTVQNPSSTTLDVIVNENGNPAVTLFAIYVTNTAQYVQTNGTLGATAHWQSDAAWGTRTVSGLTPSQAYGFQVMAANGEGVRTALGSVGSGSTSAGVIPPSITTAPATATNTTTASVGGNVTSDGGATVTNRGVCYKTSSGVTIGDNKTSSGTGTGPFTNDLSGLSVNTLYYYVAYAQNSTGTTLGTEMQFWTWATVPSAPTVQNPSASTLDVIVNENGNPGTTLFAIQCTNTAQYVQTNGSLGATTHWRSDANWGTTTVTGLAPGQQYGFRVKAVNGVGVETAWSAVGAAATVATTATVATATIGGIEEQTANGGGTVTADGGATVTNRGLCWNATGAPTVADNVSFTNGTGTGAFPITLTNLTPGGTYYVRAYAQNSAGTSYGGASNFTALCFTSAPVSLYADPTNLTDFTARWSGRAGATGYQLDVSTNANLDGAAQTVVLSENFVGMIATNGSTDRSGSLDSYMQTAGWTGAYVYENAGETKLGSSGNRGILITPALNLSANGGQASLVFDSRSWAGDASVLQIYVATDGVTYAQSGGNITLTESMATYTNAITNGTASCKVRIYAYNSSSERYYLDNIFITQGGAAAALVPGYSNRTVTGTSEAVTGLVSGATYYYRVRATNVFCISSPSATATVTTVVLAYAPSVTTAPATATNTTAASVGGNVTADGGATVTNRGVCYKTSSGVTIGDNKTPAGTGIGPFTNNLSGLSVNTLYYYAAYAQNDVGTTLGAEMQFWTWAAVPSAPTVQNPTVASLDVLVNENGNPGTTLFAIWCTNTAQYVQTNGTLGATAHWRTDAGWGTIAVTNLSPNQEYGFQVQAVNGAGVLTAWSGPGNATTRVALPSVTTAPATATNTTTASVGGNVTSAGGAAVTNRGVCYKTSSGVTIGDNPTTAGTGTGPFTNDLSGLSVNTLYYYVAYAQNSTGTALGSEMQFWTRANTPGAPTVGNPSGSTLDVTVDDNGNPAATLFAIWCTNTAQYVQTNGTLGATAHWRNDANWSTITVSGLAPVQQYGFRVKAVNGTGVETALSAVGNGTTLPVAPTVATLSLTDLGEQTANGGGNVTADGGATVTNRGVCWNTTGAPTVADTVVATNGTGTGMFYITLTNLTPGATYYVRAFAQNSAGTGYGGVSNFAAACFGSAPTSLYADPTNTVDFTARWDSRAGATGYQLDVSTNAVFDGAGLTTVLSENFVGMIATNSSTDRSGSLDSYMQTAGWTGAYVYENAGETKLGSSGNRGILITPALNLSANGGQASLVFDSRSWAGDASVLQIYVATDGVTYAQSGGNITLTESMATYTNAITNGTASCKVRIYAYNSSSERYYLDNIFITQGGDASAFVPGYAARPVSGTSQIVTGLVGNTLYYFRVRATNDYCVSANSSTSSVTTSAAPIPPSITTASATATNTTTASVGGNVTADGGTTVTNRGVCYKTSSGVTIGDNKTPAGSGLGPFTNALSGLSVNILYYYVAYAQNSAGTTLGVENQFWTWAAVPSAPTVQNPTASTLEVIVNENGNPGATLFAIQCTNTAQYVQTNGTLGATAHWLSDAGWGTTTVTGLAPAQQYGFRVKAVNGVGVETAWSAVGSAATPATTATVATATIGGIGEQTANGGGTVTTDGGSTVTNRGLCWNATGAPTVADNVSFTNGTGTGAFSITLTGLTPGATYYVRAYAQNGVGTSYGGVSNFAAACFGSAPTGLYADPTNAADFTARWSLRTGATGYQLDVSTNATFTAGGGALDLFISEYVEGSANNKAIELYNGTAGAINLSSFSLQQDNAGNGSIDASMALPSYALSPGSAFVVVNSSAGATLLTYANLVTNSSVLAFNGDDVVYLLHSSTTIDVVGVVGGGNFGADTTLVRQASAVAPNTTYSASDWTGHAVDTFTNLGAHTGSGGVVYSFVPGYSNLTVDGANAAVTGLSQGVTYYYRVRATNLYCVSAHSTTQSVTTIVLPAPEIAVLGTNMELIADGSAVPSLTNGTDFGMALVLGETVDRTFGITNVGTANLTITGVTTTGTHQADFLVLSFPQVVSPGGLSNLVVRFDPSSAGIRSATLHVLSDDADEADYDFAVQGTGSVSDVTAPRLSGWGINTAGNTNLSDAGFLCFTVRVSMADSTSGVSWVSPPTFAITNPSGGEALAPTAFDSGGHIHGETNTTATGTVSGLSYAAGRWTVGIGAQDQGGYLAATNFGFNVYDDDTTAPAVAEIDYGGVGSRYFSVTTNAVPVILGNRANSWGNVSYTLTDAELAEAPARDLRLAVGASDTQSGLRRGAGGPTTNDVMSISIGEVVTGNFSDYSAGLSSANATNAKLTNVWALASGFDSAAINTLMASSSNKVSLTAFDDDSDRADDSSALYGQTVGWIVVQDDDVAAPELTRFSIAELNTAVGGAASDLIFSEYVEGSSQNKALEIYNGTGSAVDMGAGQYYIQGYHNGATTTNYNISLTGTLGAGSAFVVVYNASDATLLSYGNLTNSQMNFNGDDALALRKGGVNGSFVDSIGRIGQDPGTEWSSGGVSTLDHTLRRKASVTAGDTTPTDAFDPSLEWDSYNIDTFSGLGSHTMTAGGQNLTDGQLLAGIAITGLVADAGSGIYGINESGAFAPTATLYNAAGLPVAGRVFQLGPNNGGGTTTNAVSNNLALAAGDITLGVAYTCRVVITDYDQDRVGDQLSATQTLSFVLVDDDTNAPVVGSFRLASDQAIFNTCAADEIAITGRVTDASGMAVDEGGAYFLVCDSGGTVLQSNRLYAAADSAATGTVLEVGLHSGSSYTVQVFSADNDIDRGAADQLWGTNAEFVFTVDGTGGTGTSDLMATNLLVNDLAAGPSVVLSDGDVHAGDWSVALTLWATDAVYTNGGTPAFSVLNTSDVPVINNQPWTQIVSQAGHYYMTNAGMPAVGAALVQTGIYEIVWSASNETPCVAQVWSNRVVTGGTNLFNVTDDDQTAPIVSSFSMVGGVYTLTVTEANSGFAVTGLVQDAGSGVAFASEPTYFLFYSPTGAVLASNSVSGFADGDGRVAAVALSNEFSGLDLSCGIVCTIRLCIADGDADRLDDRARTAVDVLALTISGEGGPSPEGSDLLVDDVPAISASLTDAEFVNGGWKLAMTITREELVTNGPYAPTFMIRDPSNRNVYAEAQSWPSVVQADEETYYATHSSVPAAMSTSVTAVGSFTVLWSARSEGICFGSVSYSTNINPRATFTVVDDDPTPPFIEDHFSVAGGTLGQTGQTQDCSAYSTNLNAGDIAIIGMNTFTSTGTNSDSFAFLAVRPIPAGTQIKFTDNGWTGSALYDQEGVLTWTADNCVTAGTVVIWKNFSNDKYTLSAYTNVNVGNIYLSSGINKRFEPNTWGEQILAYQGTEADPHFIYCLQTDRWGWPRPVPPNRPGGGAWRNSEQTALPPGLIPGETCVAVTNLNDVVLTTNNLAIHGMRSEVLAYIGNPDNWMGNDTFVYPLDTWTFTFPELGSIGGSISDYDVLIGGWDITGRVMDAISGLATNTLYYEGRNTNAEVFVSASFTNSFANGTVDWVNIAQKSVEPGLYDYITIGTNTVWIYATDVDSDRANDAATSVLKVPFTIYDDDAEAPQFLDITWNGSAALDTDQGLTAVVITTEVQDVSSGLAFTSAPPQLVVFGLNGAVLLSTNFANPGGLKDGDASNTSARIWTDPLNLAAIMDCGTYTCQVVLVDADNDRPDDRRTYTNLTVIDLASGSAIPPQLCGEGLQAGSVPLEEAQITDSDLRTGGWSLEISLDQPSGIMTNAPLYPHYFLYNVSSNELYAHAWSNYVRWGSSDRYFSGTNHTPPIAEEDIDLIETGMYQLVWMARSMSACDSGIEVSTNMMVIDDDDEPPAWVPEVIGVPAAWTNAADLSLAWEPATDPSGVTYWMTTNDPASGYTGGVAVASTTLLVSVEEGIHTNWLAAADNDNDRRNDDRLGPSTQLVWRIDRTPPPQINAFSNNLGVVVDEASEIALAWAPVGPGDHPGMPLSPWDSYMLHAAEIGGPTTLYTRAQLAAFGVTNTAAVVLSNLIFGSTYNLWIAGRDEAGNVGTISETVTVQMAGFHLTQGLVRVESFTARPELAWTAKTEYGEVIREYDILYADSESFSDALSNRWRLATSGMINAYADLGGTNEDGLVRRPPEQLTDTLRFYRGAPMGRWRTNEERRTASEEIYAAKSIVLVPGRNWVAFPGEPDSNTVLSIFGDRLPRGSSPLYATKISWYQRSAGIPVTNLAWLGNDGQWRAMDNSSANEWVVPLHEGVVVQIPTNTAPTRMLYIGRIPTNQQTQLIRGDMAKNFVSFRLPAYMHPVEMNLTNANHYGFAGGVRPGPDHRRGQRGSDLLYKWNGQAQGLYQDAAVWLNTNDNTWRLTSPGWPVVPTTTKLFGPDEALVILSASNTLDWVWTNKLPYALPTRFMSP